MMPTSYFRTSKKEYCHISDEYIFIFNSKEPTRIPEEFELGEGWGILSVFNYIFFFLIFSYSAVSIIYYGMEFFTHIINYGGLFLLFVSLKRIQDGINSSKSPTIARKKIKSILFKTPRFSYPRVVIYFDGPEGKVLRRTISVLYKQEALDVLKKTGLVSG